LGQMTERPIARIPAGGMAKGAGSLTGSVAPA
jgi:hypothetical protein